MFLQISTECSHHGYEYRRNLISWVSIFSLCTRHIRRYNSICAQTSRISYSWWMDRYIPSPKSIYKQHQRKFLPHRLELYHITSYKLSGEHPRKNVARKRGSPLLMPASTVQYPVSIPPCLYDRFYAGTCRKFCLTALVLPCIKSFCPHKVNLASEGGGNNLANTL